MGRKTLLAAALTAALAGLVACGTTPSGGGAPDGTGSARASMSTGPLVAASPSQQQVAADTSRLPAGIHAVRITLVPGANDRSKTPGPVTVTSPAAVGKLVALVDALPLSSGTFSCPMADGRGVQLTFLSAPQGTAVASAFAAGNGCGGVTLTTGSKRSVLGQGNDPAKQALAIAGIGWNPEGTA
jgi:hypothetical protein